MRRINIQQLDGEQFERLAKQMGFTRSRDTMESQDQDQSQKPELGPNIEFDGQDWRDIKPVIALYQFREHRYGAWTEWQNVRPDNQIQGQDTPPSLGELAWKIARSERFQIRSLVVHKERGWSES